jgi:hypothetical protein
VSEPTEWVWTGDDAEDHFRFRAFTAFGFDVDEYDAWLRTLPTCPAREELRRIRDEAKAEGLHGRAMKRLLHLLWVSRQALDREQGRRSLGGRATAEVNRDKAKHRDELLKKAAKSIIPAGGRIKNAALAAMLSERGHGGKEAIRKKLPKLLPRKKTV